MGDRIVLLLPPEGIQDTGETARAAVAFHRRLADDIGPFVAIVFQDRVLGQDGEARSIHRQAAGSGALLGVGLVASNVMARAIATFFIGLQRPVVPTKLFPDVPSALAWARGVAASAPAPDLDGAAT